MTLFSPDYKKNGGYWLEPGAWGTKIFTGVDYDKRDLKEDFPVDVNEWHHVSITVGPKLDHVGIVLTSRRHHFDIIMGSCRDHVGTIVWNHFLV